MKKGLVSACIVGAAVIAASGAYAGNEEFFLREHKVLSGQHATNGDRLVEVKDTVTGKVTIHQAPTPTPDSLYPPIDWQARPFAQGTDSNDGSQSK